MRIVCVGGGPAGLYSAILLKRQDSGHSVRVIERNPESVTNGWGIVFWDPLLDSLYRSDRKSAREIKRRAVTWRDQEVRVRDGQVAYLGGYGFSIGRQALLDILTMRALDLGVDVTFDCEVRDPSEVGDADLIVVSDGANSSLRRRYGKDLGSREEAGGNKYAWLGTQKVFNSFTFAFQHTIAGWIWMHAYPFAGTMSTCVIECSIETWKGLGLDALSQLESLRLLEGIFASDLGGHQLMDHTRPSGRLRWLNFIRISNTRWHHKNLVLVGDAAHTTHFTIGSGTTFAIEDAIGLVDKLPGHMGLESALSGYGKERRAALRAIAEEERNSASWFESVDRHVADTPTRFADSLERRRGGGGRRSRYVSHLAMQKTWPRKLRRASGSAKSQVRAARRYIALGARLSSCCSRGGPGQASTPREAPR